MSPPVNTPNDDDEFSTAGMGTNFLMYKLMEHISHKGFQAGSVLGTCVLVPGMVMLKRPLATTSMMTQVAGTSALAMTGLSTAGGLYKCTTINREGFEDRVYRLHYNTGQNRTDLFSSIGVLAGMALTAYYFRRRGLNLGPLNLLGGAAFGSAAGVLAHVATAERGAAKEGAKNTANIIAYELTQGSGGK